MRDESVARNYALTLMELAERHEGPEVYGAWMHEFSEMLALDPKLKLFLETPRIDAAQKKTVLRGALGDRVPRPFLNFILITIDKRRQRLLRLINAEFQQLLDEKLGRQRVEVTLARSVDEQGLSAMKQRLSGLLGRDAIPEVHVRPAILGGIIVRTGDTVYDGSIRHRMERLRRRMLTAEIPHAAAEELNSPNE